MRIKFIIFLLLSISFFYSTYAQSDPPIQRKTGCSNPKFTAAELKAYQELVSERADIDKWRKDTITGIDIVKKDKLGRASRRYSATLNGCKDETCNTQAKATYDNDTKIAFDYGDKTLAAVREKVSELYAEAQDHYNTKVGEAIKLYCRSYKATGHDADVTYSGIICSLSKPFSISGTYPSFTVEFKFVPEPSGGTGTASYTYSAGGVTLGGNGPYTIKEMETDSPKIVWTLTMTMSAPPGGQVNTGTAEINIVLTELTTKECEE